MNVFDDLMYEVDNGRAGLNLSLSTGLPKLDNLIGGVGKATYYLVGANLGIGKTAFVDHSFILNPYHQARSHPEDGIKIRIFYYSFEISRLNKIAKWVCYLIYKKTGLVMDIKEVFSRRSTLAEEKYQLIVEMRDYIDQMMDFVHIFDQPTNPTGLYKDMRGYAEANGKIVEYKKLVRGKEFTFQKYIANDPKEIVLYVEDHIGLVRTETDLKTKKDRIDKGSEYAVGLRNFFGISKVAISQFNREIADTDRRRFGELTIQLEDFKDTGNASEDANVVMGLFNPLRYNLNEYSGMTNLIDMGGRYRNIITLKNRDGSDMIKHHINMLGEVGHFREFPDPYMHQHLLQARNYTQFK